MTGFGDRILLVAFTTVALATIGLIGTWPDGGGGIVAVVFPPWIPTSVAAARATRAGADLVAFGRLPFIVLVRPARDGYGHRALEQGAVVILDAGDRHGCATPRSSPTTL